MIKAQVIADSITKQKHRLTTLVVTMPRYILAEFNTHRMFSRNSASSRAIPFKKMVESIKANPFIPVAWQKDHKGMQGTEYFTEDDKIKSGFSYPHMLKERWLVARDNAIRSAEAISFDGLTKQLCNRLLEPFMWHTVIVSATEWENFFNLRCPTYEILGNKYRTRKEAIHFFEGKQQEILEKRTTYEWLMTNSGQADIHMMATAEAIWDAINESTPRELKAEQWHIPFGEQIKEDDVLPVLYRTGAKPDYLENYRVKIATAMCARVSYTVVGEEDKPANYENDIKLHDRLLESGHYSPFEHCGRAMTLSEYGSNIKGQTKGVFPYIEDDSILGWSRNFRGFIQYRALIDK